MGKKRIANKRTSTMDKGLKARSLSRVPKKKLLYGVLHVQSTYNNNKLMLTDKEGNAILWSTSGSLGFKGAKKGTPFAAAKIGELIGEKAVMMGLKEAEVIVKGVGAGRESAIRAFSNQGINLVKIKDETPCPHNGPRPPKPRRV